MNLKVTHEGDMKRILLNLFNLDISLPLSLSPSIWHFHPEFIQDVSQGSIKNILPFPDKKLSNSKFQNPLLILTLPEIAILLWSKIYYIKQSHWLNLRVLLTTY